MYRYIEILFLVIALAGCQSVVELPEGLTGDDYLVLNSIVTSDEPVHVSVSRSIAMTDYEGQSSFPIMTDADVSLSINGRKEQLLLDSTQQWYVSTSVPTIGDTVRICAIHNGDTAYSEVVMPNTISFRIDTQCISRNFIWTMEYRRDSAGNIITDSAGNELRDTTGWDMRPQYKATIRFKDPYPQRDGYLAASHHINEYEDGTRLVGSRYAPTWNTYTFTSASNIVLSQLGYNISTTNFTSDNYMNGDTLSFYVNPYFFVNRTSTAQSQQVRHIYLVIDIYHLSYDYYNFLATANLSLNYSGNTSIMSLLGEPEHTFCNISGGLGIVGVQTLSSDTIVLY